MFNDFHADTRTHDSRKAVSSSRRLLGGTRIPPVKENKYAGMLIHICVTPFSSVLIFFPRDICLVLNYVEWLCFEKGTKGGHNISKHDWPTRTGLGSQGSSEAAVVLGLLVSESISHPARYRYYGDPETIDRGHTRQSWLGIRAATDRDLLVDND